MGNLVVRSTGDIIYGHDSGVDVLHRHRRTSTSGIGMSTHVDECILLFGELWFSGKQHVQVVFADSIYLLFCFAQCNTIARTVFMTIGVALRC